MTKLGRLTHYGLAAVLAAVTINDAGASLPAPGAAIATDADREFLASIGGIYRNKGVDGSGETYNGIAAVVPRVDDVRIIWWVDNEMTSGIGQPEGDSLIVKWGEKYPAIYFPTGNGGLSGEWDDGAGRETLELFAPIEPEPAPALREQYRVEGKKPDGSAYSGSVSIRRSGDVYVMVGQSAAGHYRGKGKRQGNLLSVNRGDGVSAVYALNADGTMRGLLGMGRTEELLTPVR